LQWRQQAASKKTNAGKSVLSKLNQVAAKPFTFYLSIQRFQIALRVRVASLCRFFDEAQAFLAFAEAEEGHAKAFFRVGVVGGGAARARRLAFSLAA
jgi:hypothetical protein